MDDTVVRNSSPVPNEPSIMILVYDTPPGYVVQEPRFASLVLTSDIMETQLPRVPAAAIVDGANLDI